MIPDQPLSENSNTACKCVPAELIILGSTLDMKPLIIGATVCCFNQPFKICIFMKDIIYHNSENFSRITINNNMIKI